MWHLLPLLIIAAGLLDYITDVSGMPIADQVDLRSVPHVHPAQQVNNSYPRKYPPG